MGRPKALVELDGEALVRRAVRALVDGGCTPVVVVLGAAAAEVAPLLSTRPVGSASSAACSPPVPPEVRVVVAAAWAEGMGASLRAGLAALAGTDADAVVVHLVDLPGVTAAALARLAAAAGPDVLARAAYGGRPGHPVVLGRAHWTGVAAVATGDTGARGYLAESPAVTLVECADIASPGDVDTPEQLARLRDGTRHLTG